MGLSGQPRMTFGEAPIKSPVDAGGGSDPLAGRADRRRQRIPSPRYSSVIVSQLCGLIAC